MSAETVELPENSVEILQQKILEKRESDKQQKIKGKEIPVHDSSDDSEEISEGEEVAKKKPGFRFAKADKNWDVDEDAELEFIADKKPIKMTVKQMRDAAAGGVAVRERMRRIAEEKKALHEPFKGFKAQAQKDPLGALEKMFGVIRTVDPDLDFNDFLSDLAKQAQTVAQMEPNARKAYQLERQVEEQEEKLTEVEQINRISELKSELMEQTGMPEERIYEFGQHILQHPILSEGIEDEEDLMKRIGDLAEEVEMQKASYEALRKAKPDISHNDPLIFELTRLLKANPDFDEQDLGDIAHEVLNSVHKAKASQKLSKKQRWTSGTSRSQNDGTPDFSRMKPIDALLWQARNKKQEQQKNSLSLKRI